MSSGFAAVVGRIERRLVAELALEPQPLPRELARLDGSFRGEPATLVARAYAGPRLGYVRCVEVTSRHLDIGNVLALPRREYALPVLGIDLVEVRRETAVVVADLSPMSESASERAHELAVLARHRQAHPEQQLLLLSGDIHTGAISRIVLNGAPPAVQLVSSALTNVEAYPRRRVAELITRLQHETVMGSGDLACRASLLDGEPGADKNPYPGLNVGFLRCFRVGRREWGVRVELSSCDASQPGKPLLVYARDL